MPTKERVRKLAQRLNRSTDAVLARLGVLNHSRYRSPDDMLPPEVVSAVEASFRAESGGRASRPHTAPTPKKNDVAGGLLTGLPREFRAPPEAWRESAPEGPLSAALEGYLAARPSKPPPLSQAPPAPEPPPPSSAEASLRDSLGAALVARRRAEEFADAILRERDSLRESLLKVRKEALEAGALTQETASAHALALELLRQERDRALAAAAAAQVSLEELRSRGQAVEARALDAEARLVAARAREKAASAERPILPRPEVHRNHSLAEALRDRGFRSREEVRNALAALLQDSRFDTTLASLRVEDLASFAQLLRQKLTLTCGACALPPGRSPVEVEEASRCEICGGSAIRKAAREFADACRHRGIHRVNLVGGSPSYLAELQQQIGAELDLRGIDGTVRLDHHRARQHAEGADLTLVWGGTFLDHAVSSAFTTLSSAKVLSIPHRGLGGMLKRAAEAVNSLGPWEEDPPLQEP